MIPGCPALSMATRSNKVSHFLHLPPCPVQQATTIQASPIPQAV